LPSQDQHVEVMLGHLRQRAFAATGSQRTVVGYHFSTHGQRSP
jgi:hypothetical protein